MSDFSLDLDPAAVARLAHQAASLCDRAAEQVAAQARANAAAIFPGSGRPSGIVSLPRQSDEHGPYADVGYTKHHPGHVLFFTEVGTVTMSPQPHLRLALTQVRI